MYTVFRETLPSVPPQSVIVLVKYYSELSRMDQPYKIYRVGIKISFVKCTTTKIHLPYSTNGTKTETNSVVMWHDFLLVRGTLEKPNCIIELEN